MNKLAKLFLLGLSSNAFGVTIDQVYDHLRTVNNGAYLKYDGVTYSKPSENILRDDQTWLLQTPLLWGHNLTEYKASKAHSKTGEFDPIFKLAICSNDDDCGTLSKCEVAAFTLNDTKLCQMPEHIILNNLAKNIESATYSVDIVQLGDGNGPSREEFTDMLKNALYKLAKRSIALNHEIDVRILEGSYTPYTVQQNIFQQQSAELMQLSYTRLATYVKNLVKNLPQNNKLKISVANMRSCQPGYCFNSGDFLFDFAWNHGKFTNVDNYDLITGGENYFGEDYFGDNPVSDSSIELVGPIANSATEYANVLWNYVNSNQGHTVNYCYTYANGKTTNDCMVNINPAITNDRYPAYSGLTVKAMSATKLNHKVLDDDADQSEIARVYAFKNATATIKISQEAIFNQGVGYLIIKRPILPPVTTVDGNVIQALAYAIHVNKVNVSIITSNLNATNYPSYVDLNYIHNGIRDSLLEQFPSETSQDAEAELKTLLHLANIDFDQTNNTNIRNHNKFWMVDDHLFYLGSHNIYPSALQQYGVIIDSSAAGLEMNNKFWTPMWTNSDKLN